MGEMKRAIAREKQERHSQDRLMSAPVVYASSHHYGSHPRPTSSRPYYGGGHHTTSHGGSDPGSVNPYHRVGHYVNPRSSNRYGVHKPR